MTTILVAAPHPDDETLGVGGTILRHIDEGCQVHWLIASEMIKEAGYKAEDIKRRQDEIEQVAALYNFSAVHRLGFPAAALDQIPTAEIISAFSTVVKEVEPEVLYLPFPGDVHSDHEIVFNAGNACSKWFRYPGIKKVRLYETLSETEFNIDPTKGTFRPNLYCDISDYLDRKITAMDIYQGESGEHPFPRNPDAICAKAALHGSTAGVVYAEAFMTVKEII